MFLRATHRATIGFSSQLLAKTVASAGFKSKPTAQTEELSEAQRKDRAGAERAAEAEHQQRGTPRNSQAGALNAAEEALGTGPEITSDDSVLDAGKKIAGRVIGTVMGDSVLDTQAENAKKGLQEAHDGGIKGRDVMPKDGRGDQ